MASSENNAAWSRISEEKRGNVLYSVPSFVADVAVPELSDANFELCGNIEEMLLACGEADPMVHAAVLSAEALSSSQIEDIYTSACLLNEAENGTAANHAAEEVLANLKAVQLAAEHEGDITESDIIDYHKLIAGEASYAGRIRNNPNLVSTVGNNVNPPPDKLADLLADWVILAGRTDMPLAVQIAVEHSQFETIHPFYDGNGRTGRTLIQRTLKNRECGHVPISCAYYPERIRYYDTFMQYKNGDIQPVIEFHGKALIAACEAVKETKTAASENCMTLPEAAEYMKRRAEMNMIELCANMSAGSNWDWYWNAI